MNKLLFFSFSTHQRKITAAVIVTI